MEQILDHIPNIDRNPIVAFTILLLVILTLPSLFERLKLPGLVGLLVAGVCLGPYGLKLLNAETETMKLLSDIGKIYLMFVAGLEIDLADFRRTKNRSLSFGLATFLCPLILGTIMGRLFGFGLNASILIGSLLASHTLLGYPIVNRLGVVRTEAVTVTIGATIFTDIAALLVLAICIAIHAGEFSPASLAMQLLALGVYAAIVLFGFDWAGKEYFRRTGDEESNQFLFVLLAVFLAAVGAELINVDKIVGAFLAGLAVNDVVGRSPVEEKVEFVGSTLFIPCFFVNMGLLIDIPGFVSTLTSELGLTVAVVGVLFGSKFLAALVAKLLFRYNWAEALTMWSLSLPQVAATLAAALAGLNAGLITNSAFNTVIVLMLVTAVLGPVLTARFARKLSLPSANETSSWQSEERDRLPQEGAVQLDGLAPGISRPFTVMIPVANPQTEMYLMEMGALLARHESGVVMPLSIAKARIHMDEPELDVTLKRSQRLLARAVDVSKAFQAQARPLLRIDSDVAHGISRAAKEQDVSLIVMGWSPIDSLQARLFGNVIDSVFWSCHCPVAVMRLREEPVNIHRVLVPVKNITPEALQVVRFAYLFADENQAQVTLLHIRDRKTSQKNLAAFEAKLTQFAGQIQPQVDVAVKVMRHRDVAGAIASLASNFELVILRSTRRRTAGGLAVSDATERVLAKLACSVVLFGEPHLG